MIDHRYRNRAVPRRTASLRRAAALLLLGAGLFSSGFGCSSNGVKNQYYTLHPLQDAAATGEVTIQGSVGVGPIELPEALQSQAVVSYGERNEVLVAGNHLWAGDLKKAMSRVIAANLGRLTGKPDVWSYPWGPRARPDKQIAVELEQLGGQRGSPLVLHARWTLYDQAGRNLLGVERIQLTANPEGSGYDDYVAALNDLVNGFSRKLADSALEYFATEK